MNMTIDLYRDHDRRRAMQYLNNIRVHIDLALPIAIARKG
jgi:hypothetical protein